MPFHTFCSAKFSTCIAVRILKFSVLHGKGESKYRPVATNFQCLKNCCPLSHPCWGKRLSGQSPSICCRRPRCHLKAPLGLSLLRNRGPSPNPAPALRWFQRKSGVSLYIAPSIRDEGVFYFHRRSNMAEMKSPNAHARENRNDTPRKRKTHIIKVRVTAEEKLRIAYACKELHLTQSELVRRVLYGVNVK